MHRTSYLKVKAFADSAGLNRPGHRVRVLDIGSKCHDGQSSYRPIFDMNQVDYTGLDLEEGEGVDIVPRHPFLWPELETGSFDVCLCGQVFEHNPFFWVTFAEIARVLKPGGHALIIAPARGPVHRYPIDCWRFYPDSWSALCVYTGMELEETYFEESGNRRAEPSLMWCDSFLIARKPELENTTAREAFYDRLSRITATTPEVFPSPEVAQRSGPVVRHYQKLADYLRPTRLLPSVSRFVRSSRWLPRRNRIA